MRLLRNTMIWVGGAALLAATAIDTLAVIGRQVGLPLRGSIELIQAAVLVAGGLALVAATAVDQHARVHLVVERLETRKRLVLDRASDLLTALFFACLLAGSVWLSLDLWNSHELSEIVGVPWRWLRVIANLCLVAVVVLALRHVVGGKRK
jgi:TRAP-type transport system small permease protein